MDQRCSTPQISCFQQFQKKILQSASNRVAKRSFLQAPPHNCAKTSRVIFGDPKFREKAQFKRTVCTRNKPRYATFIRLRARYKFASANSVQQCDAIFSVLGIVSCRNERFSLSRKTHVSGDLTTSIVLSYSTFLSIDDIFKIIFYILTLNFSLPQKEHWRVASTQWPF